MTPPASLKQVPDLPRSTSAMMSLRRYWSTAGSLGAALILPAPPSVPLGAAASAFAVTGLLISSSIAT